MQLYTLEIGAESRQDWIEQLGVSRNRDRNRLALDIVALLGVCAAETVRQL